MSTLDELNADLQRVNDSALTAQILIEHGWRKKPTFEALTEALDEATSSFGTGFWSTAERDHMAHAVLALLDRGTDA